MNYLEELEILEDRGIREIVAEYKRNLRNTPISQDEAERLDLEDLGILEDK